MSMFYLLDRLEDFRKYEMSITIRPINLSKMFEWGFAKGKSGLIGGFGWFVHAKHELAKSGKGREGESFGGEMIWDRNRNQDG